MNCQHCQNLLLDHLYGLLDGAEAAAVDAHLGSCPTCAAARAETARVQGLIARAAKSAFPQTRFEAPAPTQPAPAKSNTRTPAPGTPPVLPFPAKQAKPARKRDFSARVAGIVPWAIAAAVLLAIPSTVVPVLGIFKTAGAAQRDSEVAQLDVRNAEAAFGAAKNRRERSLSDAEFKSLAADQAYTALRNQYEKAQERLTKHFETRNKLAIDVQKPASIVPGAPNDFVVVLRDSRPLTEIKGQRMIAEIHAVDASDAVIFTQPLDHERDGETHPMRLPASAWSKVKPEAELFLVVAQVDDITGARTELQEKVKLAGPVFTTLLVTDKPTYRPGERLFFRSLTLDRISFKPPTREQILKYELLDANMRPVNGGLNVTGTTELVRVSGEGKVDPVRTTDGQPVRGVGCGEFVLPADLKDGDYVLVLSEQQHPGGFPATVPVPVTRTIKVRSGATDNYRKQIEFKNRASYRPGERVEAYAELKEQDRPVAGAAVVGVAVLVDGAPIGANVSKATDKDGRAHVSFALPSELLNGDVRLKVTFRTPHGDEAVAKHVPVIGNRLTVEFFPECGDTVVAGVPCKVYVRATTPAGQPVDIRGVITDGRRTLTKVASLHDDTQPGANRGLAVFTYTPELGVPMWLKLESPAGVYAPILPRVPVSSPAVALLGGANAAAARTGFLLPDAVEHGVVMSVLDPITGPGEPIRVQLHSVGRKRELVIGAYTRGKLSDTQKVTVGTEQPETVKLMAGTDPRGGVVRVTCFEEPEDKIGEKGDKGKIERNEVKQEPKPDLRPVAERLVFRKPGEVLNLTITAARADTNRADAIPPQAVPLPPVQPGPPQAPPLPAPAPAPVPPVAPTVGLGKSVFPAGSPFDLSISATDEKGNPTPAILYIAALNSGAAQGAKDRLMTTHFLLAGEVKNPDDLEHADFLLTNHPKAAVALDLLLGTQGWRRFAEQTPLPPVAPAKSQNVPGQPDPSWTQLMLQNGAYATKAESSPVLAQRELFERFVPLCDAAMKSAEQAKAALDSTRADTGAAAAVTGAESAATTAKQTAEAKAAAAEAAREPVRKFRANVWFGVAGLAALALGCGFVAARRSAGRFPLGFSTLGSLGLAAFLVIAAGWDDRATAATSKPTAENDRASLAKPEAPAPNGVAVAPAPHPRPDADRNPQADGKFAKIDDTMQVFPPAPLPPKGGVMPAPGGSFPPRFGDPKGPPPPAGGAGPGGPESFAGKGPLRVASTTTPLKPVPPPVIVYPQRAFTAPRGGGFQPNGAYGGANVPGGMNPVPLVGPPPPAPGAPSVAPAFEPGVPLPAPLPLPLPPDGGWDPHRIDGVSKADIEKSKSAKDASVNLKKRTTADYDKLTEAVNRDNDIVARWHNLQREQALNGIPSYFLEPVRPKKGPEPTAPTKPFGFGADYAQQVRGILPPAQPLVVREFAAPRPAPAPLPDAADSPDTILWQPVIVLPSDGKTTLTFHLGSAPNGYEIVVAGHTLDGRLGAKREFVSVVPAPTNVPVAPPGPVLPTPPTVPPPQPAP